MQKERRKNERFEDSANSLIFNLQGTAGKLTDISPDGLSFIYIGDDFNTIGEQVKIDILCASDVFYVKNISCQLISINNAFTKAVPRTRTVRCSVKFNQLTDQQDQLIKEYIEKISLRDCEENRKPSPRQDSFIVKSKS